MNARSAPLAVLLSAAALVLAVVLVVLWASDRGPAAAPAAAAPVLGASPLRSGDERPAHDPLPGSGSDLAAAPAPEVERTASSPIPLSSAEPSRAQLRGRVLEHDGRPAADAVVQLQRRDTDGAPTTWEPLDEFRGTQMARRLHRARNRVVRADERGEFAFDGLTEGLYQLRALRAEGYGAEQLDLRLAAPGRGPPVEVELVLPPSSWLEGVLVADGRTDLAGLLVRLRPVFDVVGSQLHLRGLESQPRPVDAEGRFRIAPLAPGNYHLLLTFPLSVRSGRARLAQGDYEGPTLELEEIHVPPGGSGQRFFLGERLPGRVRVMVMMNRQPLPGIELRLVPEASDPGSSANAVQAETDGEGRLELSLFTGAWTVGAILLGKFDPQEASLPEFARGSSHEPSPVQPERLWVSTGKVLQTSTLTLTTYPGSLRLLGPHGEPLARVVVTVRTRQGRPLVEGTTDAGGWIAFSLPAGPLQITDGPAGSDWSVGESLTWTPNGLAELELPFGPPPGATDR